MLIFNDAVSKSQCIVNSILKCIRRIFTPSSQHTLMKMMTILDDLKVTYIFQVTMLKGISLNTDEVTRLAHLGRRCDHGWKASLEGFPAVLLWGEVSPYEAKHGGHHVLHQVQARVRTRVKRIRHLVRRVLE